MKNDLKERVQFYYDSIKYFQDRLEHLRENECDHSETEITNYMWAPGHINPNTKVCSICGKVLQDIIPMYVEPVKCDACGCHPTTIIKTKFGTFCEQHAKYV